MTPIIDNGHGGMVNGVYKTAGKRSPNWSKGILYEGMFNRWVVNGIIERLDRLKIPYYNISPGPADISLKERVRRANKITKENKDTYLLSIHANAGGGYGIEGFTSFGDTNSDLIASRFLLDLKENIDTKFRFDYSDNDPDKESNFYILKHTTGSALLIECGFMDNKEDYLNLWSKEYLNKLIESLTQTIIELYNN